MPTVDVVILSRVDGPARPEVERGLRCQRGVKLVVHRIVGAAEPEDRRRWEAIARARNEGKSRGASRWLMFLDDDVVLDARCVLTLVNELRRRPAYAALAADYLSERRPRKVACHVSMGATLFRREALDQIHFDGNRNKCECQACCDDLRQLHWGIDYCGAAAARHLPKSESSEPASGSQNTCDQNPTSQTTCVQTASDPPLITCLCVTQRRVRLLRKSIECFRNQTYPRGELVIVHQSDDESTRRFLSELVDPSIHPVEAPAVPRLSLGALRNIARQAGAGSYVATWDDDDWHNPTRLEQQMKTIQESGKRGCLLSRCTLYDGLTKRGHISRVRTWEPTLVVERAALPPYPDLARGEDTAVVNELVRQDQLAVLDRPELYVYVHHGSNTWDRRHWQRLLNGSEPLGAKASVWLTELLRIDAPEQVASAARR
jgi:glycosyltransferase involved in cell wall biosynthesis